LKTSKSDLEKTVDTNFPFFVNIFCSKDEMTEYWNKFSEIGDELTIFTISQFYVFLKQIEERKYDSLRLIMLASIIEKLNSKEDYLTFPEWISKENKKEELKKRGVSLWDEYNKIYGKTVVNERYHHMGEDSKALSPEIAEMMALLLSQMRVKKEEQGTTLALSSEYLLLEHKALGMAARLQSTSARAAFLLICR